MLGRALVSILAVILFAGIANAQATQPAAAAGEIRRSASASSASNSSGPSATRVALSLAAVLALIVVLYFTSRRFLPRSALAKHGGGGAVQVLARTAISPKQRIILLQVGRRILVVADGGATLTTLSEITDANEAAALIGQLQLEKPGGSFSAALSGAMEKFRAAQTSAATPPTSSPEPQPNLASMRQEIEGLAQRVRGMAR
jgi:flagellar biogenesis protein FliO